MSDQSTPPGPPAVEGTPPGPVRPKRRRARWIVGVVAAVGLVGVVVLALAVKRDLDRRGLPVPDFASLASTPDTTLHGTVAFISEAKNPQVKERQACARIALATGAAAEDVFCWDISESALATAVWRADGRLLVTAFDDPVGDPPVRPVWAKIVDVASGAKEDVPVADLGKGAKPSTGPATNQQGDRLVMESRDGAAKLTLLGSSGPRRLLEIDDANPNWSLQTGPVWSPDFAWVMTWDGRLLVTTVAGTPSTRVLVQEASGSPYPYETTPNISIRADDVPLG